MAYSYYRQRRYIPYGQYRRQGGRYTTRTRYSKKGVSKRTTKGKSKAKPATTRVSGTMQSKLRELDLITKHGKPQKVVLKAEPGELLLSESPADRRYYHVVPVTEALMAYVSQAPEGPKMHAATKELYVTGVTLSLDLFRDCPVEMDIVCGPLASLLECPVKQVKALDDGFAYNSLDDEGQAKLCGPEDKSVTAAASSFYSKFNTNDSSVFGGTVNSKILPNGNYVAGTSRKGTHTGRVSLQFKGFAQGRGGGPSVSFIKEPVRAFWRFDKAVPISDLSNGRYVILVAVRPECDGFTTLVPPKGSTQGRMYGALRNIEMDASVRYGL
ncbi:hypothetical protein FoTM2_017360 [Fusarium oxysporum f. sp. vasinfectum]|uniref:Uncharacterized protein n=1 Tax=Fusarium oxysporum f. sp. vasinfectum 25433 TaxID=1089449 RepID=X0KHW8_FUSOX|nr:hypothetical protein FOTG_18319 [Fusarium oxysporum f. sp. vasinfectum 25433]KAK2922507.1 hypothetical protein FoTM2_017360 [Fusarium oxysporum f. sp. vasinfectum]